MVKIRNADKKEMHVENEKIQVGPLGFIRSYLHMYTHVHSCRPTCTCTYVYIYKYIPFVNTELQVEGFPTLTLLDQERRYCNTSLLKQQLHMSVGPYLYDVQQGMVQVTCEQAQNTTT